VCRFQHKIKRILRTAQEPDPRDEAHTGAALQDWQSVLDSLRVLARRKYEDADVRPILAERYIHLANCLFDGKKWHEGRIVLDSAMHTLEEEHNWRLAYLESFAAEAASNAFAGSAPYALVALQREEPEVGKLVSFIQSLQIARRLEEASVEIGSLGFNFEPAVYRQLSTQHRILLDAFSAICQELRKDLQTSFPQGGR
jgi:hypothetical protein